MKRKIKLQDINVIINDEHILQDINLEINEGERIAIIGPNGVERQHY